jgi:hypothetical protein
MALVLHLFYFQLRPNFFIHYCFLFSSLPFPYLNSYFSLDVYFYCLLRSRIAITLAILISLRSILKFHGIRS